MANKGLIASVSLGFVLVLAQIWMLTQADALFPANPEVWKTILIVYTLITAFVFSWDALSSRDTERKIFSITFIKAFPKFLVGALITLVILFAFGMIVKGNSLPTIKDALSNVGLAVILFHALIVAVDEELIFRGWLVNELRAKKINEASVKWGQAIIFAGFHWAMTREILLILIYIPLAFVFLYVRDKYSPKTQMANAGVHFAWNVFILGFMS